VLGSDFEGIEALFSKCGMGSSANVELSAFLSTEISTFTLLSIKVLALSHAPLTSPHSRWNKEEKKK